MKKWAIIMSIAEQFVNVSQKNIWKVVTVLNSLISWSLMPEGEKYP
jgi:hypothetical protein